MLLLTVSAHAGSLKGAERYCLLRGVDPSIVKSIAKVEGIQRKGYPVVYPYIIRINSSRYRLRGLPRIRGVHNVYDCLNKQLCTAVAKKLVKHGIKNIDLGGFQINYLYYNGNKTELLSKAFDLTESFETACDITARNLSRYGYNANAIARYHSSSPAENYRYAVKLYKVYSELKRQ